MLVVFSCLDLSVYDLSVYDLSVYEQTALSIFPVILVNSVNYNYNISRAGYLLTYEARLNQGPGRSVNQ